MVAGFESFNRNLYKKSAKSLKDKLNLKVFSDAEIQTSIRTSSMDKDDKDVIPIGSRTTITNPEFAKAFENADLFIGLLIFDYDDVLAVT